MPVIINSFSNEYRYSRHVGFDSGNARGNPAAAFDVDVSKDAFGGLG